MDLVDAKDNFNANHTGSGSNSQPAIPGYLNKVREHFLKVFKALFTDEDTADLILENPEYLLKRDRHRGQPKGKTSSSITQLSGGEKT